MYLPEPVVFCINLFYLFHRHGFCQVSRLVHIKTFLDGSVVGDELKDDGDREYGEFIIFLRDADDHIGDSLVDSGIFRYKEYHIGTSRLYLTDVGDGLREDVFLGRDGDHRDMVCDQGDGSVL